MGHEDEVMPRRPIKTEKRYYGTVYEFERGLSAFDLFQFLEVDLLVGNRVIRGEDKRGCIGPELHFKDSKHQVIQLEGGDSGEIWVTLYKGQG